MARTPGAYRLGKALLDNIVGLHEAIHVSENGSIALNNIGNYGLVRDALLDAIRDAGFIYMCVGLAALMPVPRNLQVISDERRVGA